MKVVTSADMQALDRRTIKEAGIPGMTLMSRAGAGVVAAIERHYPPVRRKRVVVLCGKGNNGGDGFVVARLLRQRGATVTTFLLGKPADLKGDAAAMCRRWIAAAGRKNVNAHPDVNHIRTALGTADLVVDALFGTGLCSSVTGPYADAIDCVNQCYETRRIPIVAVDLPSGLHGDTGHVLGTAVHASLTVTFGLPKQGLYVGPGIDHVGHVEVIDIGIPQRYIDEIDTSVSLITPALIQRVLPPRPPSAHKGTYGHAAILAGSPGKTGAAVMAARGALRVGTGLVTVATPASVNATVEAKLLEAMTVPLPDTSAGTLALSGLERIVTLVSERDAVAIGPGLTTHAETVDLVRQCLPRLDKPLVLDADALNALQEHTDLLRTIKHGAVVTPHPGEMARLDGAESARMVNADRLGTATRFARHYQVVVVLKGARTIIAQPDGAAAVCPTGNPGMATGGTGDVLAGMITGFLAQGLEAGDAACVAAYLHGLAGDVAAADIGPVGMTAGDLIDRIPSAIQRSVQTQAVSHSPQPCGT